MKTVGLVMIVKNEERALEKCLAKAKKLVDEIYITDTGSTDKTISIAKKFGAHISHFEWKHDFAAARNYALAQSACDWNLVLDADEYLIKGRKKDILDFIEKGTHVGAIQRHDSYLESNGEISTSYTYTTRLMPKDARYEGRIHEQVASDLPIAPLPLVFDHDGYLQEGKGERNLKILLEQLADVPDDPYTMYQIARTMWLMHDFEGAYPYFKDFYRLVPEKGAGYRTSGIVTYIYNLMELQRFKEGLEIIKNEQGRLNGYADYHFACGVFYMQMILSDVQKYMNYLPQIERSYMRCLEIGEVPAHEGVFGNGSFKAAYNLGVWFEVNGNRKMALHYYEKARKAGYAPAAERIKQL